MTISKLKKTELQNLVQNLQTELEKKNNKDKSIVQITAGAIPTIATMLGWIAADVAADENWFAILPAFMTLAVLSVSLPHVAKGLRLVLYIKGREAVALAIALDLSMIVCECILHFVEIVFTTELVCWAVMVLGLVGSTVYNIAGFQRD